MRSFVICFVLFFSSAAHAQQKPVFFMMPQVALHNGDHSSNALISLVSGIAWKKASLGIGAAIDYYKVRTVPLFLTSQLTILPKQQLLVYADMGINTPWAKENQFVSNISWMSSSKSTFQSGLYTDVGVGKKIKTKYVNLLLAAGYSFKSVRETNEEIIFSPISTRTRTIRKYEYEFNRIVLKLGIYL